MRVPKLATISSDVPIENVYEKCISRARCRSKTCVFSLPKVYSVIPIEALCELCISRAKLLDTSQNNCREKETSKPNL